MTFLKNSLLTVTLLSVTVCFCLAQEPTSSPTAATSYSNPPNCGTSPALQSSNLRIVGGNESQPGEFPWLVSLQYNNGHMCGASVVGTSGFFVLTAAHCFIDTGTSPKHWRIVAGDHRLSVNEGTERTIQIEKIILHEQYSPITNENDIALLKLKTSLLPHNDRILPVCLVNGSFTIAPRTPVTVAGWGTQKFESNVLSDTLKRVNVYTYDTDRCGRIYRTLVDGANVVPEGMLCAGDITGGKDSCQGDSGGPLMKQIDGRWHQVGIVSWGASCGRPLLAGVYTKVSNYRVWVESTLRRNGGNAATLFQATPLLTVVGILFSIMFQLN